MNLHRVASAFDNVVCADAYNPATEFLGQLDLYDDSKRDGVTVERRILSVSPNVTIPAKRTITAEDQTWIVGQKSVDSFQGKSIRHKYIIHQAKSAATFGSPFKFFSQTLSAVYLSIVWLKDVKEAETSSTLSNFVNIYFADNEIVKVGDLIVNQADAYRVRNVYVSAGGFKIAESNQLPSSYENLVSYKSIGSSLPIYVPAADSYTTLTPTTIKVITDKYQHSFVYDSAAAPQYEDGDLVALVAKASAPNAQAADSLTFGTVEWRVISVQDFSPDCWELQIRRA